jgi:tetratricopeptide (TPR) repeat protein
MTRPVGAARSTGSEAPACPLGARRRVLRLAVLAWLWPALAAAYSGSGKESWAEAQKYLTGHRASPEELARIQAMSKSERLTKAVEYLLDAERSATTEQETRAVAGALGTAYNDLALDASEQKDFRAAASHAAEAIKRLDDSPVLHFNLGSFQSAAGDYWDAASSFARAKEKAADADLKARAGQQLIAAYMRQGQSSDRNAYDYAIREIESQLYDRPEEFGLLWLLGESHLLKGDGERALQAWERARKVRDLGADRDQRYQQLAAAQKIKTEKQFVKNSSLHFQIEFEDKTQSRLAEKLLDLFEQAYDEVGARFSMRPDQRVFVTVYSSQEFNAAVKVPWAGGVHQANRVDLRVSPRFSDGEYRNVIMHEYAHHLVALKANQKAVPAWFNEGIAMQMEPGLDTRPFMSVLDQAVRRRGKYIPFARIALGFTDLPSEKHVRLAYAQGYTVVRVVFDRHGIASALKVLEGIGGGQDFETSFHQATRIKWPDFEKEWFQELQDVRDAGPGFDGLEGPSGRRPAPGGATIRVIPAAASPASPPAGQGTGTGVPP